MIHPPLRTKVIATVGPACDPPDMLTRLVEAGVSVFRLNFSHGSLESHEQRLRSIRAAADRAGRVVAVLGDLCGPKIRVGTIAPEGVRFEPGQVVTLGAPRASDALVLPVTYPALADEVRPGHRVLINDGAIRLLALEQARGDGGAELRAVVKVGGLVTSGKGINLPDSRLGVSAITPRDWECVEWAARVGVDLLALSFVRRAEEVRALQERLATLATNDTHGVPIPVIAKIEKPEAVKNLEEIIEAADGVMVARGDLGVEMDISQVPVAQKTIVASAAQWGKPCIVATQMLESMIEHPSPTRAEASDVANAIFDGADAVMLSAETATGKHPALVVETMRRIAAAAEGRIRAQRVGDSPPERLVRSKYRTAALAHGAWHAARDAGARAIACWSELGGTARYLSQNDFGIPILAYSTCPRATRRMALLGGVHPIHAPDPAGHAAWTRRVEDDLKRLGWARPGDAIILLAGAPLGRPKATNTLAIHSIGNPTTGYIGFDDSAGCPRRA